MYDFTCVRAGPPYNLFNRERKTSHGSRENINAIAKWVVTRTSMLCAHLSKMKACSHHRGFRVRVLLVDVCSGRASMCDICSVTTVTRWRTQEFLRQMLIALLYSDVVQHKAIDDHSCRLLWIQIRKPPSLWARDQCVAFATTWLILRAKLHFEAQSVRLWSHDRDA